MNNVSLLFYIADVISNVKPVMAFLAVFTFILTLAPFLASMCGWTDERGVKAYFKVDKDFNKTEVTLTEWESLPYRQRSESARSVYVRAWPKAKIWGWLTVPLFVVMLFIANALPSRETIFMIATSEFVEDFSQTETGTEIGSLARETLDYLKSELKKLKDE